MLLSGLETTRGAINPDKVPSRAGFHSKAEIVQEKSGDSKKNLNVSKSCNLAFLLFFLYLIIITRIVVGVPHRPPPGKLARGGSFLLLKKPAGTPDRMLIISYKDCISNTTLRLIYIIINAY